MANIELIKVLRERTGAGIMDCKNALVQCNDDIDAATDWLREKGIAKQAKKADRIAAEGLALISKCEKCGAVSVVEVNSETDFVANSDVFRELTQKVADKALDDSIKTTEDLVEATAQLFSDATLKVGEKMTIRRFDVLRPVEGQGVGSYIHGQGKRAVAVLLEKDDPELAKGIAMHIAAGNPKYVTEKDIPAEVLENERKVQSEVVKNDEKLAGKPAAALEKIIEGKVNKMLSESVLYALEYYLFEPGKTIGQVCKEHGNNVIKFVRYEVGEGLEKRQDDFASEVMSQIK